MEILNKVPGKITIGTSDIRDRFIEVAGHKPVENINMDYILHRVDFGDDHPEIKAYKQYRVC